MATRLNPITTPRFEARAEKARRNKEAALAAFIGKKAEIDEMLARLQALSDDHFNAHPDEVNWGRRRHPRTLRQPPQAHHRQRLWGGRTRRVISGPAGTPAARPARLGVVGGSRRSRPRTWRPQMTKLSDTQLVILSAAAQREDRNVLPLPGSLRGGAAAKVVGALLKRALIADARTALQQLDPLWDVLFPAEQSRIVALLVERVDGGADGLNVKLRVDGLGGLAREMLAGGIEAAA
jgi:hypothetical protein